MSDEPDELLAHRAAADRLDQLAEVAELMGDADGAVRMRHQAADRRMQAMKLLDSD